MRMYIGEVSSMQHRRQILHPKCKVVALAAEINLGKPYHQSQSRKRGLVPTFQITSLEVQSCTWVDELPPVMQGAE